MPTPLEKRKTIFNNGVPNYTRVRTEYETALLGTTPLGKGTFNPSNLAVPPVPKTYQEIITIGTNELVQRLNEYNYIDRRNDILQLGDSRGRSEKYPPESLLHTTGGPGYAGKDATDLFIRGGAVLSTARALEDVVRVGNFLTSGRGLLWILREEGLQLTNPRPETRLYNPITTTLNVASQHLGIHLPRHGLNPFNEGNGGFLDFGYNTYSTVKDYLPGTEGGKTYTTLPLIAVPRNEPKLLELKNETLLGKYESITSLSLTSLLGSLVGTNVGGYVSPPDKPAGGPEMRAISYLAATNAPYGGINLFGEGIHRSVNTLLNFDGKTISRYPTPEESRMNSELYSALSIPLLSPLAISSIVAGIAGDLLSSGGHKRVESGTSVLSPSPELLKTYKSLAYGELDDDRFKYTSAARPTLVGASNNYEMYPKLKGRKPSDSNHAVVNRGFSDPGNPGAPTVDRVNIYPLKKGEITMGGDNSSEYDDLVPLVFYDLANDQSLVFRAILSAINDTITPEWNEYTYVGNPQTYYTYNRTTRDFAFTFHIATNTAQELKWNWMKLNRFVGMCYPSYTSYGRTVGPFLKLTLGDMLTSMAGYISALTITVDDNTPWEINLFNDDTLARLPHVVECAVTYRAVGNEPLESTKTRFYAGSKMYDTWKWESV